MHVCVCVCVCVCAQAQAWEHVQHSISYEGKHLCALQMELTCLCSLIQVGIKLSGCFSLLCALEYDQRTLRMDMGVLSTSSQIGRVLIVLIPGQLWPLSQAEHLGKEPQQLLPLLLFFCLPFPYSLAYPLSLYVSMFSSRCPGSTLLKGLCLVQFLTGFMRIAVLTFLFGISWGIFHAASLCAALCQCGVGDHGDRPEAKTVACRTKEPHHLKKGLGSSYKVLEKAISCFWYWCVPLFFSASLFS